MANTSFANEIEKGDRVAARQIFRVADNGTYATGTDVILDSIYTVQDDAEYAGLNERGRETVTFSMRSSGVGLLFTVVVDSARVIRLV